MSETEGQVPPSDEGLVEMALRERRRRGWSWDTLAKKLGLAYNTVKRWEGEWVRIEEGTRQALLRYFDLLASEPEGGVPAPEPDDD